MDHLKLIWAAARDPKGMLLIRRVRKDRLTFLSYDALLDLRRRARRTSGSIIEAGCALGGSAIVLAASKPRATPLHVYDVFGMIPSPGERDGDDVRRRYETIVDGGASGIAEDGYYGYEADLYGKVNTNFERLGVPVHGHNVHLVKGLFQDTVHPTEPVGLAHIDGDWYESVSVCLERIWPSLVSGGAIVIDDYDDWSGCRTAVDEFTSRARDCVQERHSRLHLVKK